MIAFEGVNKTYRTKDGMFVAVNDLSFEVEDGEFFTLLGPSGCGKTTTLRMLAGLERPDSGTIRIGETTVYSSSGRVNIPTHKRKISMVFQSYAIWPHMTVFGNVAYPLQVQRVAKQEIRERVDAVLALVDLEGLGSRPATRLSGGQQQRVALARALVSNPQLLLLDEPLSNLDAQLRSQMRVELKSLQSRIGVTTVYVTHDQQEALAMSDDVCVMNHGRIAQRGAPNEIYHRPRNRFTAGFIGSTNFLEGRASAPVKEGLNTFETSLGTLTAYSSEDLPLSCRDVAISIRPEVIDVSEGSKHVDGAQNCLLGSIEQLVFLGETIDCQVRVDDELLQVKAASIEPLPVGSRVALLLPPDQCIVLSDVNEGDAHEPSSDVNDDLAATAS